MGVETDFVLARPDQADAALASVNPPQDFGGVYAKGLDPISLGALVTVLTGEEMLDDILDQYREVATENDGGKSVSAVPDALRAALVALPEEEIAETAAQWASMEDFELTGWDGQLAEDFIRDLKALLATDAAGKKELWMVISV
jgi:hypothetical protein